MEIISWCFAHLFILLNQVTHDCCKLIIINEIDECCTGGGIEYPSKLLHHFQS